MANNNINDKKVIDAGETVFLKDDEDFSDIEIQPPVEREILGTVDFSNKEKTEEDKESKTEETKIEESIVEDAKDDSKVDPKTPVGDAEFEDAITSIVKDLKAKQVDNTINPNATEVSDYASQVDFSSIFENEEDASEVEAKDEDKEKPTKTKAVKIDPNDIKVIPGRNQLEKERDLKAALFGNKAAFQVVAPQSGYMAQMVPLVNKDLYSILYSNLSRYEYRKAVYRLVWEKIINMTGGRLKFEDWLKMTAVEDAETLYYGIYCATFQNDGYFGIVCPECGEEHNYVVNHMNLISTSDKDSMKAHISAINSAENTTDSIKKFSMLQNTDIFKLNDSKLLFEVRTPSLYDTLELLRLIPEEAIDKDPANMTNMLYIKRVLVPSKSGANMYDEHTNSQGILKIIDNLSINDGAELQDAISERLDANRITYSIKNAKCPSCQHVIDSTPVNIENLLFTAIFEKIQ